jgi:putative flippase GtrA
MQLSHTIKLAELFPYIIIGTIATAIDWSLFSVSVIWLKLHYVNALILGYTVAAVMHYVANKIITFKCESKQIGSQFSIFVIVILSSLILSMAMMAIFINLFAVQKITARMITTILMILPNYLLHKHITFSKKIFFVPQIQESAK